MVFRRKPKVVNVYFLVLFSNLVLINQLAPHQRGELRHNPSHSEKRPVHLSVTVLGYIYN